MIAAIDFVDLQDDNYLYHAGDVFPRSGKVVSPERIAELAGSNNKLGQAVIIDKPKPKETDFPMNKPVEAEEKTKGEAAERPRRKGKRRAD